MATSELDTTPVEWKAVRENLVQLHCEDVSWDRLQIRFHLILLDICWVTWYPTSALWYSSGETGVYS